MTEERDWTAPVDPLRSVGLCADYTAALVIDANGTEFLMLSHRDAIGHEPLWDPGCALVSHEQTGALPTEFIRRLATNRCGRRTKSGRPCRARVAHAGAACRRHNTTKENTR
jgi:hypothetical protein